MIQQAVTTQKKVFKSGMTTLIISNEEMEEVMKIKKFLEKFYLLIKKCYPNT